MTGSRSLARAVQRTDFDTLAKILSAGQWIPAFAGMTWAYHPRCSAHRPRNLKHKTNINGQWIPAFAGMTWAYNPALFSAQTLILLQKNLSAGQ
jgi:hypothetical protein